MALSKLDWVCRGCGSRLRKPRWIDLLLLGLSVVAFIVLIMVSIAVFIFLFDMIFFEDHSGLGVVVGVVLTLALSFSLYAYFYPYLDFHRLKEARPHCVKCLYPVERHAEACPECGEVIPWNTHLPEQWTRIQFGNAQCNRCKTAVPRSAGFEKGGEWVCRGCGTGLVQPPHINAIGNAIQAFVMVIAIVVFGVVCIFVMSNLIPEIHGIIWFFVGAAVGVVLVMMLSWLIFPFVTAYIVKDARVHCSACGVAIPPNQSQCPSCTKPVRYAVRVDEIDAKKVRVANDGTT